MGTTIIPEHDADADTIVDRILTGGRFTFGLQDTSSQHRRNLLRVAHTSTLEAARYYCRERSASHLDELLLIERELGRRDGLDQAERAIFDVAGPDLTNQDVIVALDRVRARIIRERSL